MPSKQVVKLGSSAHLSQYITDLVQYAWWSAVPEGTHTATGLSSSSPISASNLPVAQASGPLGTQNTKKGPLDSTQALFYGVVHRPQQQACIFWLSALDCPYVQEIGQEKPVLSSFGVQGILGIKVYSQLASTVQHSFQDYMPHDPPPCITTFLVPDWPSATVARGWDEEKVSRELSQSPSCQ